jgi:hypothetical protein
MTKSLRERQLSTQILEILKDAGKPLMLLSIYRQLEHSGEKLGQFWKEKAKETVYELVRKRKLKDVYGGNTKVKLYKWVDPDVVCDYATTTYRGNFKTNYIPPRDIPSRVGADDHRQYASRGM